MILDELFDHYVSRPVARPVASVLAKYTAISANQVTVVTGALGALTGLMMAKPNPFVGGLLMVLVIVMDCLDGELARRTSGGGWRGRAADGISDSVLAIGMFVGMVVYTWRAHSLFDNTLSNFAVWLLLFAGAAASFVWHSAVVDDIKQRLKDSSVDDTIEEEQPNPNSWIDRQLHQSLVRYVKWLRRSTGKNRPGGYPLFKKVRLLGPTQHHLACAIAAICCQLWSWSYVAYAIFALVPANLYMWFTLRQAQRGG